MYGNKHQIHGKEWKWSTHEDGESNIDFDNDGTFDMMIRIRSVCVKD